jgi:hypothetical protein
MSFSDYKQLSAVIKEFRLHYEERVFEIQSPQQVPEWLQNEIAFNLNELPYASSEAFICESLLFPILREVWKPFKNDITLWSHTAINYTEALSGIPDYLFAKRSELGKIVMDSPYIAVVEAKKDDFSAGWGQCAVEMYTLQQMNQVSERQVFGVVSNGDHWEFASLQGKQFIKYTPFYKIYELDSIYTILFNFLAMAIR